MNARISTPSGNRNPVSGFLRLFVLSLLMAAFAFTSLHARTVAYVANSTTNTVSVIDTSTNTVTATIPVGNGPQSVVVAPDGTRVFTANGDNTISVISTASNAVVATIPANLNGPGTMGITPDGKTLYIPSLNGGTVLAFSTVTNSVITTIAVPNGNIPLLAAVTPDGAHVYVLCDSFFFVIDTASNTISAPFPVDSSPGVQFAPATGMAFSVSGNLVYIPGATRPNVSAVSTASNMVSTEVALPAPFASPVSVVITPDGSRLFVLDPRNDLVSIIDTANNTLEPSTITVGRAPNGMAITPDGALLYVANTIDGTISVIDTAADMVTATVSLGPAGQLPVAIAIASVPPPPLTAVAGPNQTVTVEQTVHLDGSGSFAPNTPSADLLYAWSFVSRPIGSAAALSGANTATPSFVADRPGTFVVQLVVTDPATTLSSTPSQVTISSVWSPPTANAGAPQSVTAGSVVSLNGSGSSDPNGLPLTYAWSFTSKPAGSAATITPGTPGLASFTADVAGSYTVQLVVSDAFGSSQPSTVIITATTPETAQQP